MRAETKLRTAGKRIH